MYEKKFIQCISIVALVLAIAACEQAQEPTQGATVKLEATKIGEVSDLVAASTQCDVRDGRKDQGIRLQIPPKLGAKVSALELGSPTGHWVSCSAPSNGAWRLEVTEAGADKPMGEKLDLSKGGVFVIHAADNGTAFKAQLPLMLKGVGPDGQEVFHVAVSG